MHWKGLLHGGQIFWKLWSEYWFPPFFWLQDSQDFQTFLSYKSNNRQGHKKLATSANCRYACENVFFNGNYLGYPPSVWSSEKCGLESTLMPKILPDSVLFKVFLNPSLIFIAWFIDRLNF